MIEYLSSWCENIIIGVIIVLIIEMITPKRNLKYINIVSGFFILYLIISPITVLGEDNIDNFFEKIKEETDVMMEKNDIKVESTIGFNNINDVLLEGIKIDIVNALKAKDIEIDDVEMIFSEDGNSLSKIMISLKDINDLEKENEVRKIIKNKLEVEDNIIYIN